MGYLNEPLDGDSLVRIVSREEWGARDPQEVETPPRTLDYPITHLTFTHTKTDTCKNVEECTEIIQRMQNRHMDDIGLPDIIYNFLIGGDGLVYEARGWSIEPLRQKLYEYVGTKGVEIAYIGDYEDEVPPAHMIKTALNFVLYGMRNNRIGQAFESIHLA